MPRGYWGAIIAAFGWLSLSAQAPQPKAQPAQSEAAESERRPAATVEPIRVEIVNQAPEPAGYQDPCKGDEGDRRSDLCAQWETANAARDAAYYAWLQLWGAAAGIVGLLVTIWLTRRAVKAAQQSVAVAQATAKRQLRAYMTLSGYSGVPIPADGGGYEGLLVGAIWINSGQTPATKVRGNFKWQCFEGEIPPDFDYPPAPDNSPSDHVSGPGQTFSSVQDAPVPYETTLLVIAGTHKLLVWGFVDYRDAFGTWRRTETASVVEIKKLGAHGGELAMSFRAFGDHNAMDDDCRRKPAEYA